MAVPLAGRTPGPEFVVAVDSGGTSTRVGCFDLAGGLLSVARGRGGAAHHDERAALNVADTVRAALEAGDLRPEHAVAAAVGVSGIGRPGSNQGGGSSAWAESFYPLSFLACPTTFVNDAVVAHRGALLGEAGVVVVAGTGSMVLAIDVDGAEVESGQLEHYAGAARHVVFEVVHRVLQGRTAPADAELLTRVLDHWGAADVDGLRDALLRQADLGRNAVTRRYGDLAPAVTALADVCPLADRALRDLTDRTASGVLLLAPLVGTDPVLVTVTGSLACDPAFVARLEASLDVPGTARTRLLPPSLGPLGGAALLAYSGAGVEVGPDVVDRLRRSAPPA